MQLGLALLGRVRTNVLQGTEDVRWDWRGSGNVTSGGPVAVLISDPGEFVQLSLRVVVLRDAIGHNTALSSLRVWNAVGGLEAVAVRSIVVHLIVLLCDVRIPVDMSSWCQSSHEDGHCQLWSESGGESVENILARTTYYFAEHFVFVGCWLGGVVME